MIFAIGGVPPFSGFPGKVLIFQGALQNGNYIGLALMIITSLIAMYSLFRILFYMYFGDKDGEEVNFKKIPLYRKRILSILVVVVIAIGIAAPVVLNVTSDATELNTRINYIKTCKSAFERRGLNESNSFKYYHCILMGIISR